MKNYSFHISTEVSNNFFVLSHSTTHHILSTLRVFYAAAIGNSSAN